MRLFSSVNFAIIYIYHEKIEIESIRIKLNNYSLLITFNMHKGLYVETGSLSSDSTSADMNFLFNESDSDDGLNLFGTTKYKNHVDVAKQTAHTVQSSDDSDEHEDERKKYLVPGLVGFKNLGNTCYMNAALKALCATHFASYMRCNYFKDRLSCNMAIELGNELREKSKLSDDSKVDIKKKELEAKITNSLTYQLSRLFRKMYNIIG